MGRKNIRNLNNAVNTSAATILDTKVESLIHVLLEVKSQKKDSPVLARDLLPTEILQFIQENDSSLRRMKRIILEGSIMRVIRKMIGQQVSFNKSEVVNVSESEDEDDSEAILMDYKVMNN